MSKRARRATANAGRAATAGQAAADREQVIGQPLFVTSIAISAFLLFTLELLAGRLVLPVFGGSPAVWTTALCFFTGLVFFGYLYAHLVVTRVGQRRGGILHLVVATVVLALTVLAPADLAPLRRPDMPAALNVLLVLTVVAGPPAFLLATTTPLLSAWFAARGRDPWWLYAASNSASLVALLAYPFILEPTIPLSGQRILLTVTLVVFVISLVVIVAAGRRTPPRLDRPAIAEAPPLARRRQVLWLIAAIIPAGLLSATTTYLATDLVSAPLLWVAPLALYLASFVIAFSARGRRILPFVERLVPAAATLMWIPFVLPNAWPVTVLAIPLLSYAVIATAVHGRLANDRPDEAHLTRFYLVVSLGGLVATAFVALVAPLVFNSIYEYPVLLVAGLAVIAVMPGPGQRLAGARLPAMVKEAGIRLAPYLAIGVVFGLFSALADPFAAPATALVFLVGGLVIVLAASARVLAIGTAVAIVAAVLLVYTNPLLRVRTFFGVIEVRQEADGAARSEYSGTTLHGVQFVDARGSEPTSYYVRSGPLGHVFDDLELRLPDGADIGVVGLGTGTIAAYERPVDHMTFFEIDQAVVDIARDARQFDYLAEAPNPPSIVLGDARLALGEVPPATFDLLVLDAFSSDAVPVHLLTREAIKTYQRTLKPGGVIAFHLSNRYYELLTAVASTARSVGMLAEGLSYVPSESDRVTLRAQGSDWVVVGQPKDVLRFEARSWREPFDGPVLTDDFSDIVRLLRFP